MNQQISEEHLEVFRRHPKLKILGVWDGETYQHYLKGDDGTGKWDKERADRKG
jgi:hypothetical protein